jgi:raffinose/stachyose/melibiose transport system substrate-binding protein
MPSEEWKDGVGQALTAYAADQTDANWDGVVSAFVDGWATEYQLANQ